MLSTTAKLDPVAVVEYEVLAAEDGCDTSVSMHSSPLPAVAVDVDMRGGGEEILVLEAAE